MSQTELTEGRKQRGQVSLMFLNQYTSEPDDVLFSMLTEDNAQVRTAAASILGERKLESAVEPLCTALAIERALYSRLAICEALVSIDEPAIDPLIALLGKIGSNQHRELPEKGFYKRSYPLPRDITARILIRMGLPVLEKLEPVLPTMERNSILEAIDVIGHISNQHADGQCHASLLALYDDFRDDDLMMWKILRAFQAFSQQQVTDILLQVIGSSGIAALRWEAVRSLGLQDRVFDRQLLIGLKNDGDNEIRNLINYFFSM